MGTWSAGGTKRDTGVAGGDVCILADAISLTSLRVIGIRCNKRVQVYGNRHAVLRLRRVDRRANLSVEVPKVGVADHRLNLIEAWREDGDPQDIPLLWQHADVECHAIKVVALDVDRLTVLGLGIHTRSHALGNHAMRRLDVNAAELVAHRAAS